MPQAEEIVMEVLKRHPSISLCILFGSHASGRAQPSSDLDVAVASDHRLGAAEKIALIDDLALPFGGPVDVVDLTAVSGPILKQVLCKGRILVNRRPALLARLMLKMWYDQADLMPNRRTIVKQRVEAFAHG
jgi:predicted nucleotidyltransferase